MRDRGYEKYQKGEGEDNSVQRPEDMDWSPVSRAFRDMRDGGRWREMFLGVGMRWWKVEPVSDWRFLSSSNF